MKRREILYFGSFNPVHRGHIALAEWIVEQGLGDEVVLIVSPQNPHKQSDDLAPEFSRYEMCQLACEASRYPDRIKVSAVELTLDRPSYTINTLRFLREQFGGQMEFSVLIGADNLVRFDTWRDYEEILDNYPVLVYPRRGYEVERFAERVTVLEGAPLHDYVATDVRRSVAEGLSVADRVVPAVEEYILQNKLYTK
ncbi:MAG: nicotinate (nicotinamide) nucleotide adenylyltransferase [Alistipes sp.]|nr:nicotinate (nicotinamide) nucleotide adenylyltransferase [Alistipes sp.]